MTHAVIVRRATTSAFGLHHARFRADLQRAVDLEVAAHDDALSFFESPQDDVRVAGSRGPRTTSRPSKTSESGR